MACVVGDFFFASAVLSLRFASEKEFVLLSSFCDIAHFSIASRLPARKLARHERRCILPLEVFGMPPGLSNSTAYTPNSWYFATARLMDWATTSRSTGKSRLGR